jgi:hypothetical protein
MCTHLLLDVRMEASVLVHITVAVWISHAPEVQGDRRINVHLPHSSLSVAVVRCDAEDLDLLLH